MELLFRWMILGVALNGLALSLDENKSDIYIYIYTPTCMTLCSVKALY